MSNKNMFQIMSEQKSIDEEYESLRDHMSPGEAAEFERSRGEGSAWLRGGFAAAALVLTVLGGIALFG